MARIVLGLGTSHSGQLSTPPEFWAQHAEYEKHLPSLVDQNGDEVSYDQLLSGADPSIARELTAEKWQQRYDACQQGVARLAETLAEVAPHVVIIVGDDQRELFHDQNMPAMLVYWGERIFSIPNTSPALRFAAWAYGEEQRIYPVAADLGLHLVESLMEQGFDVSHSRDLGHGRGMGHAFAFVQRRILDAKPIPLIPIMINTYYPPNQPLPSRCYKLGRAIARAVEEWKDDERVAIIASGGLSHFVIDEEQDRAVLKAMAEEDVETLVNLPPKKLNSGTSETRNWIVTAAACSGLDMEVIDYEPCYRTPAGTGCGMAFARWM